jgi:N-acylneuraminate cytidylyltransferase
MQQTLTRLYDLLPARPALVALDFDGVLTDNAVFVCEDGREWVRCSRGDGMGITLLKRAGIRVAVLSTETNPVVRARCTKLGIECIQGCDDKAVVFAEFLRERGIDAELTVFVGNDVNDVGCLQLAGCAIAVADAHPEAVAAADALLTLPGGHGAVRQLCDLILKKSSEANRKTD